jgi:hypothetical protein
MGSNDRPKACLVDMAPANAEDLAHPLGERSFDQQIVDMQRRPSDSRYRMLKRGSPKSMCPARAWSMPHIAGRVRSQNWPVGQ